MSIDPEVIRAEPYTEVGEVIQRHVGPIIERWSRRAVQEQPNAQRVHHAVLVDHLHDFLWTLGHSLMESEASRNGQHCLPATEHGEQRWETGWSLAEVVRDYQILRLAILDFLEENLSRPLGYREVLAIGLALDEAIAASVVMYVKGREQFNREVEDRRADEDRRIQERLQEQAKALQEADRRKNEFLAMLAHELRNPLAPIRNAVEILRVQAATEAQVQWARGVIERQAQQLTHIVDDLLDISRIARGKIHLQKELVDLVAVMDRAVETARPFIDGRMHKLTITLPDKPLWLDVDPARMTQVGVNLLINAAKFTDEGGQIWLIVEQEQSEAVIKVRDTGLGISAELLPLIFEPFIQGDSSNDGKAGGLGIGLSLVRSLVELHGGNVQAFSDGPRRGSEFVVRLPSPRAAPATGLPLTKQAKAGGHKSSRRILVVDDNKDSAESLAVLLKNSGHEVHTAHDGPTALEAARGNPPDVVLLDIGLPGQNGLETARRMRLELGLDKALLVAVTGYGQEDDVRRSLEAGFNAHLVKPLDLNALDALIIDQGRSS
jgi:signal transduction histidine kinase/ActR/RegA family two-component response regulator